MSTDRRELLLSENLVKFDCVGDALDENDNLVEHQRIKELDQLLNLGAIFKLNVVLQQSVERELRLTVDKELELVLHEHSANLLAFVAHGG